MVFSERTLGSRSLLKSAVSQRETSAVTAFWRDRRRGFGLPRRSISGAERRGVLGQAGSNKFLFEHVGLVEAHHADAAVDREAAAIEAGANDFEVLTAEQNDDIPEGAAGAKFICERTAVAAVSKWLSANGWTVVTSEIGFVPKQFPELTEAQQNEVGEFLQVLDEHDDVHRVWAAVK